MFPFADHNHIQAIICTIPDWHRNCASFKQSTARPFLLSLPLNHWCSFNISQSYPLNGLNAFNCRWSRDFCFYGFITGWQSSLNLRCLIAPTWFRVSINKSAISISIISKDKTLCWDKIIGKIVEAEKTSEKTEDWKWIQGTPDCSRTSSIGKTRCLLRWQVGRERLSASAINHHLLVLVWYECTK